MSPSDIPPNGATPGPEGSPLPGKKLDSWGEIASYLGREVRTVQRWEGTEGLPVRRHEHKKKSTVYAYASELDAWIKNRQPKDDPVADDVFARQQEQQQEVSGTDSPVDVVVHPVVPPVPDPTLDEIEPHPSAGKRVIFAILSLGIFCALSLGVYRWLQPTDTVQEKVRIAVLPFNYVSGDSQPDYITAGLTDVIRTKLGQLDPPHLGVIAATSSRIVSGRPIPEIGRLLNVKYVLEGNVQRAGDKVIIDVQLIQVSDQTHLWSESFPRELSDVLQVESDVSAAIARQVLATLPAPSVPQPPVPAQPGTVHAATPAIASSRHAYLQGKFAWGSRGDLRGSLTFFQQAIHDDPKFAEAYAGLAAATAILGQVPNDGMPPGNAKPKAKEAAQQALQLNRELAEAHAVLGNVAMSYDWDLATAEKELRRAIELAPNDPTPHEWYCHLLIVEGHNSEALAEARRALDLDPVNPLFHDVVAETHYFGRSYDAAIDEAQQVVKLHPGDLFALFWLGSAYREKKMYPQAIETFQNARERSGDSPAMLMAYGHAQAMAGNVPEARATLQKLQHLASTRFVPSLYPAAIHVGLGEADEAFRLLNLAYEEKIDRLVWLNVDPMADPLRSDPRFNQLMAKIGFH
ncbi:MAG TPA: tetratricopeptide repeat protein [Candidatus Cybelea sp.]|nr:tetratricopeptide repeat protein [Candidatus Cybelea sp.]